MSSHGIIVSLKVRHPRDTALLKGLPAKLEWKPEFAQYMGEKSPEGEAYKQNIISFIFDGDEEGWTTYRVEDLLDSLMPHRDFFIELSKSGGEAFIEIFKPKNSRLVDSFSCDLMSGLSDLNLSICFSAD